MKKALRNAALIHIELCILGASHFLLSRKPRSDWQRLLNSDCIRRKNNLTRYFSFFVYFQNPLLQALRTKLHFYIHTFMHLEILSPVNIKL